MRGGPEILRRRALSIRGRMSFGISAYQLVVVKTEAALSSLIDFPFLNRTTLCPVGMRVGMQGASRVKAGLAGPQNSRSSMRCLSLRLGWNDCRQHFLSSFGVIGKVVPETWLCWHVVAASALHEVPRVFSRVVTFKVSVQLAET